VWVIVNDKNSGFQRDAKVLLRICSRCLVALRAALLSLILAGRYKLIKAAGEGGTAHVYLAQEVASGRKVAVKVLKKNHPDLENMVRRFEREARLIHRLHHPNVVGLVDFVRAREGLLLLTEWVEGTRLDVLMKQKKLRYSDALSFLRQLASALGAIHAMGVVHRDLKPENIVITHDFVLKLLDFGIARATELGASEFVTSHGQVAGTPLYIAPEQAMGKATDARTDVYIFGVLAYRLLSGRHPFEQA
jgi:serine/threonine-protein kinase